MTVKLLKIFQEKRSQKTQTCCLRKRVILAILAFFGIFNIYAMRAIMSVVMMAMVNTTSSGFENSNYTYYESSHQMNGSGGINTENTKDLVYDWDSKTQGSIMGAFFYAYFITMLSGGYIAEIFSAKWTFGGSVFFTAVFTLLTPIAAKSGYVPLIIVRCLVGIAEGFALPSLMVIISRWAPKSERSRITASIFNGDPLGVVVGFTLSGWLSSTNFLGGWPSAFYVFGAFSFVWSLFWFVLTSETPQTHPTITTDELSLYVDVEVKISGKHKVPWISIFKSLPFWAVFFANFGTFFATSMLLTELPTYLVTVLHFNIATSGVLSTLPYIVQPCGGMTASWMADRLRNSGRLHITTIRKYMNSIGGYGISLCFVSIALAGYRPYLIIALLCIVMFISGARFSGFVVTHADMSPDFSGTTFGICNGISSLSGIMAPAMVGSFTEDGATIANWSKVFYTSAAVLSAATTIFAVFASAELQPWGKVETECKNKDEKIKC